MSSELDKLVDATIVNEQMAKVAINPLLATLLGAGIGGAGGAAFEWFRPEGKSKQMAPLGERLLRSTAVGMLGGGAVAGGAASMLGKASPDFNPQINTAAPPAAVPKKRAILRLDPREDDPLFGSMRSDGPMGSLLSRILPAGGASGLLYPEFSRRGYIGLTPTTLQQFSPTTMASRPTRRFMNDALGTALNDIIARETAHQTGGNNRNRNNNQQAPAPVGREGAVRSVATSIVDDLLSQQSGKGRSTDPAVRMQLVRSRIESLRRNNKSGKKGIASKATMGELGSSLSTGQLSKHVSAYHDTARVGRKTAHGTALSSLIAYPIIREWLHPQM
jgi:hypothetical protein